MPAATRRAPPDDGQRRGIVDPRTPCAAASSSSAAPEVCALESVDLVEAGIGATDVADILLDATVPPREVDGRVLVSVRVRHPEIGPWPYGDEVDAAPVEASVQEVALVPYHDWAERGPSTMRVWIPVAARESASSPVTPALMRFRHQCRSRDDMAPSPESRRHTRGRHGCHRPRHPDHARRGLGSALIETALGLDAWPRVVMRRPVSSRR